MYIRRFGVHRARSSDACRMVCVCECVCASQCGPQHDRPRIPYISKINITFRLKWFACLIFRQFRSIRISCFSIANLEQKRTAQFRNMRRDEVNREHAHTTHTHT